MYGFQWYITATKYTDLFIFSATNTHTVVYRILLHILMYAHILQYKNVTMFISEHSFVHS